MSDLPLLNAQFEFSAAHLHQCPVDEISEVAIVGRSNAGKSSTINRLAGRNSLAKVSKTPGRTRLINFFSTSIGLRLVDLPGYGYAKASRQAQKDWNLLVHTYLTQRANLTGLIIVTDARHELKASDLDMIDWQKDRQLATLLLLNKADKLRYGAQQDAARKCKRQLGEQDNIQPILFSATQGMGVDESLGWLQSLVNEP